MFIVNEGLLVAFWKRHNQSKTQLNSWLKVTRQAKWRHLVDVKQSFPSVDGGVKEQGYTIFNIKGNGYRLITIIDYLEQTVFIIDILTHSQYDRWNKR